MIENADQALDYADQAVREDRFTFAGSVAEGYELIGKNSRLKLVMVFEVPGEITYLIPEFKQAITLVRPTE